ncbi:MAG: histidine phosphatase family protein [Bryobacteraceae bacterium]
MRNTTLIFETHSTSLDNESGLASGHYDAALSPAGEIQAREMGERYKDEEISAVYCSDLQRSYRTAEIAFGVRGIPVMQDVRLRECDYGALTRESSEAVQALRSIHVDKPFPGGESYREATARVRSFLRALPDGGPLLVVGHRATYYALEHLLGRKPLHEAVAAPWMWQPGWRYALRYALGMTGETEYVRIYRSEGMNAEHDATVVRNRLLKSDIDARLAGDETPGVQEGTYEVHVPSEQAPEAQSILAEMDGRDAGSVDPSSQLDLVSLSHTHGATGEMEALGIKSILDANGISAVIQGASTLPNLSFQVLVARNDLEAAQTAIAEAQAAGKEASEGESSREV